MFAIKPESDRTLASLIGVVFLALQELKSSSKKGALVAPFLFLLYKAAIPDSYIL
jgi:hypothetical protein